MKLAILCGGKPQLQDKEPLEGIENSLKAVSGVLDNNGWRVISPIFKATTISHFKQRIQTYLDNEDIEITQISQLIFFYTGHGQYANKALKTDYEVVWNSENDDTLEYTNMSINTIVSALDNKFKIIENKLKTGLIIDACYSGDLANENLKKYVEILTSTQDGEKTYETTFGNKVLSIFVYDFLEIFNTSQVKDEIAIRDINNILKQANRIQPFSDNFSIIIGNNKELNEVPSKKVWVN